MNRQRSMSSPIPHDWSVDKGKNLESHQQRYHFRGNLIRVSLDLFVFSNLLFKSAVSWNLSSKLILAFRGMLLVFLAWTISNVIFQILSWLFLDVIGAPFIGSKRNPSQLSLNKKEIHHVSRKSVLRPSFIHGYITLLKKDQQYSESLIYLFLLLLFMGNMLVVFCCLNSVTLNIFLQPSVAYLWRFFSGAHLGAELLGQEVYEHPSNNIMPDCFPK